MGESISSEARDLCECWRARTFAAVVLLFGLLTAACGGAVSTPPPLIVLITIDTLRADHLPMYGYPRNTAPFLGELAEGGVVFESAYSNISTTSAAHASIFTSLYPTQHGVTRNGKVLDEKFVTLAELLGDAGYTTVAVASTDRHFAKAGVTQGFDHVDEFKRLPFGDRGYRPARETVQAAIDLLDELHSEPLFLWVHLYDPHVNYRAPAEYVQLFGERDADKDAALLRHLEEDQQLDLEYFDSRQAALDLMAQYDAEIRYADAELRRLFDWISDRGSLEDSVWIVTADHGEGLGHHQWLGHGKHIYNEQLRVPLIFFGPDRFRRGERRDTLTTHVDITPTILDIAGLVPRQSGDGINGRSLHPLLISPSQEIPPLTAFAERRSFADDAEQNQLNVENRDPGSKYALQDGRYKFVLSTESADELFDMLEDPYETRNIALTRPDIVAHYRSEIERLIARISAEAPDAPLMDAETLEGLRELGYIQ